MTLSDRHLDQPVTHRVYCPCGAAVAAEAHVTEISACSACPPRYAYNYQLSQIEISGHWRDANCWQVADYCEYWLEESRLAILPEVHRLDEPLRARAQDIRVDLIEQLMVQPLEDWLATAPTGARAALHDQLGQQATALKGLLIDLRRLAIDTAVNFLGQPQPEGEHHD